MTEEDVLSLLKECRYLTPECYEIANFYFYPFDRKNGLVPMGLGSPQYCYKEPWAYRASFDVVKGIVEFDKQHEKERGSRQYSDSLIEYWNHNLVTWRAAGWIGEL